MANENLGAAKRAKNDEFYTQYIDIEKEMNAYLDYNPEVFRDKTILLPCDDPEWSNFTKYFAQNFKKLGLKKLISTSYAPNSKPMEIPYQPTLFEMKDEKFDEVKTQSNGKIFTLTKDKTGDGTINIEDLEWTYLEGDGDFRSHEIVNLRDQADIVITNPPFSLFREFLAWILESNRNFVIIGNVNAITYKEVFHLIKDNKVWLGPTISSGDREFRVPDSYPLNAAGWRVAEVGQKYIRVKGVRWFTNIDHGRRHEPLALMTQGDNIRFSKHSQVRDFGYQIYDNYDAVEVSFTDAIPSDYEGVMGVPITFLDKYSPDQFEIVGMAKRGAGDPALKTKVYTAKDYPNYSDLNAGPVLIKPEGLVNTYPRILIRHRKATN